MTMKLIATVEVGSGGATQMTFNSIPATYTDLQLVISGRVSNTNGDGLMQFNGTDGSFRRLYGSGSSVASDSGSGMIFFTNYSTLTANTFSSVSIYIPNYAGAINKSVSIHSVSENNATAAFQGITAGLWSNTAAITSISLLASSWVQYSTATLYGITKGSGGATVS